MKVLLIHDVPGLGRAGDVKDVADGYGRNFLIRRNLATPATEGAIRQSAEEKKVAQRKQAKELSVHQSLATTIGRTELVFKAKVGEQHRLFGSITASDIAEELGSKVGQPIDKRHVELEEPIRHLGTYKVPIRIAPKLIPSVTVVVEAE